MWEVPTTPGRSRAVVVVGDTLVEERPPPARGRGLAGLGELQPGGQRGLGQVGGLVEPEPGARRSGASTGARQPCSAHAFENGV